jgi:hypothetical protein
MCSQGATSSCPRTRSQRCEGHAGARARAGHAIQVVDRAAATLLLCSPLTGLTTSAKNAARQRAAFIVGGPCHACHRERRARLQAWAWVAPCLPRRIRASLPRQSAVDQRDTHAGIPTQWPIRAMTITRYALSVQPWPASAVAMGTVGPWRARGRRRDLVMVMGPSSWRPWCSLCPWHPPVGQLSDTANACGQAHLLAA